LHQQENNEHHLIISLHYAPTIYLLARAGG
jgi:hypothetical protein